jgi:drug/metabolite transporter (DMT)-like permease
MAEGIIVALAAAVANAFAIVLQAAESRRSPREQSARAALLIGLARRPRWLAGTALMMLAWPLQVFALALAPITVVQPLLATTQLVLLAVARIGLRERVGRSELLGAMAIVIGVSVVVWAAPRHTVENPAAARIAAPLALVGAAALGAYVLGRSGRRAQLSLVLGAGLAYAWVDFANKLLADELSNAHWVLAAIWIAATLAFGALAFLEETSALQRRPAVTVAPVVGAVHDPLPVLMALWAGVQTWGSEPHRIAPLLLGLAVITAGAAALGRSRAVARVSGDPEARGGRRSLATCTPGRCVPGHAQIPGARAGCARRSLDGIRPRHAPAAAIDRVRQRVLRG